MPTYTVETYLTARAAVREVEVSHPIYTVECALTRPVYVVETGLDLAPPAPTAPVNTVAPVVSGTITEGELLSCSEGTWTGTLPITYARQWYRDDGFVITPIGTNSPNYTLVSGDVGFNIFCNVTASNTAGSTPQVSNTVGPIASALNPPTNTTAPVISGTPRLGQTLTTTDGTWTDSPTSYSYQWTRDGVDIGGATSSTYVLVAADLYATAIRCEVTATNAAGSSAPEASNALSSPLAPIWAIDPDAAIWVRTAGWGAAGVGDPVADWATADGRWSWVQATSGARPTRTTTGLRADGVDDNMTCDSLAGRCDGAHTVVAGWSLETDAATGERSLWAAASNDAGGSTNQVGLSYGRHDVPNGTRMRAKWAGATLATVSLTSLASKGTGPYLEAQVSGAQGAAVRVETLDTPIAEVGNTTRPSGSVTYEWLTLGARRIGAGPSAGLYWLGTVHSFVLLAGALTDAQLETVRDALLAEDAL